MTETSKPAQAAADAAERMAAMQRIGEKSRRVAELWLSKGGRQRRRHAAGKRRALPATS